MDSQEKEDDDIEFEENEEIFINPAEAVEVEVDDDIPMEDDDDDDETQTNGTTADNTAEQQQQQQPQNDDKSATPVSPDMSFCTIESHKPSPVYTVASHYYTAESSLISVSGGGDDRAYLHILPSGTVTATTVALDQKHTDSVSCVAMNMKYVSDDLAKTPRYLAVGSYDGTIVLYDPLSGRKIQVLDGPTDVEFISFHPKGGSVLLAGSIADATVWMYHIPTSKCLQVFVGHECNSEGGGVTTGSFTPDGKFAVTLGMDGTMRVWAPRTGLCKHVFKLSTMANDGTTGGGGLTCLSMNGGQDEQLAVCGGEDGSAYVVHLKGKKVVATLKHFDAPLDTNANSAAKAGGAGDTMETDDNEEPLITSVEAVGFATKEVNPNWVATGGSDGVMKVWDLTNGLGQCRQVCKVPSTNENGSSAACGGITHLNWHQTMPILFVAYADGIVRLWDARNGALVHSLSGGNSTGDNQVNDLATELVDVKNGVGGIVDVVTANDDGTVKVYKVDIESVLMAANEAVML